MYLQLSITLIFVNWFQGLSSLNKLETLRLSSNSFTGYLPSAIGTLSSLKTLDVSDNQISGTVPKELGSLSPQLVVAKISLNRLSCSLPKRIKKWRSDASPATTPIVDDDFSSQYYRDDDTYTSTVRQPFELSLLFGRSTLSLRIKLSSDANSNLLNPHET